VKHVNEEIQAKIKGIDVLNQAEIDDILIKLDGTPNKSRLGANAILGVSLAISKAGASAKGLPLYRYYAELAGNKDLVLPVPSFNVINGGSHAGNRLAFQEFMILPIGAASFSEAMVIGCEVYATLKAVIKAKYGQDACNVGDEGGFAPSIQSNYEGVELLMEAIKKAGYEKEVKIGMDVAASEFLKEDGTYDLDFKTANNDKSQRLTGVALADLYKDLVKKYPIVSIEDPFDQDDWDSYASFTKDVGDKVQVVGDDLLVTNVERIKQASAKKACNALLLKVNQIGSVTESIDAVKLAKRNGWGVMTSHRSVDFLCSKML
jgi:enolase